MNQSTTADGTKTARAGAVRARVLQVVGWLLSGGFAGLGVWAFVKAVQAEPAIVGSIATAAAAIGGVVWQQQRAERDKLDEARRERMAPLYEALLGFVMSADEHDGDEPPQALTDFMEELRGRQLLLGASGEMIQAFNHWLAATREAEGTGESLNAIAAYEDLLRAIRKDLGHDDSKLPRWDLLRVFINDIDDHLTDDGHLRVVA